MTRVLKTALPLVGRSAELAELYTALESVRRGAGVVWLLSGDAGVGKTRLGQSLLDDAARRGFLTARGRSFPVESGVPYALFADALLPVVRHLDADALAVLTRGVGELGYLFPWLAQPVSTRPRETESSDFRSRLHWHFTQFLRGLVAKQPLVVVLEDLQWADTSSLELLHFIARQLVDVPVFLFCTFNPDQPEPSAALRTFRQSAASLGNVRERRLEPLTEDAVGELLHRVFGVELSLIHDFTELLYRWSRGNPFYVEETLKALIASGDLRRENGRWTGWETKVLRLPATVRDAVLSRLERLAPDARAAAELAAVIGARFSFEMLTAMVDEPADALLRTLDELRRARVLEEIGVDDDIVYDFVHPMIRETLYSELGRVRTRLLHVRVAESLERWYGARALQHAGELSYHFVRASSRVADEKAVPYLRRAGLDALARYANREAADYLSAAVERLHRADAASAGLIDAMEALAHARQRLGENAAAGDLWRQVQQWALAHDDPLRATAVARWQALACYWAGRLQEALEHLDTGIAWLNRATPGADVAGNAASDVVAGTAPASVVALRVHLYVSRAACLQELGRFDDGLVAAEEAMRAARSLGDAALLVRVHRLFVQLYIWRGDAHLARQHGARALELSTAADEPTLAFVVHWSMGLLEAFAGNTTLFDQHLAAAMRLADELRSPVLRAWAAELALEYASARGDWDAALALGEEAIMLARALQQYTLLPRLLVWTGLIHVGRSELDRAEALIEEAWQLSGADHAAEGSINVHAVIPAYVGRGWLAHARGDYADAVRIGEEGLAIADRTGFLLWGVHRLLPLIGESALWMGDIERARRVGERLRRDAERLGHRLGIAWAQACDALVDWLGGNSRRGAESLREAAELLESIPFMPDAARLRRQLAGRLADDGDVEAAARELRVVHDRLLYLGAEAELRKARTQFRQLGLRPPPRGLSRGHTLLTSREAAVAALIAGRRSSKAIARELGISVRTVDAHLGNVYRKLGIHTRAELTDLVRSGGVPDEE